MVAVGSEQFILGTLGLALAGGRVQPFNPAHDQPGGDVLVLLAGGEVRVGDLGDLGIRYPPALVLVPDGLGVLDPNPGILGDAGDRGDGRLRAEEHEPCRYECSCSCAIWTVYRPYPRRSQEHSSVTTHPSQKSARRIRAEPGASLARARRADHGHAHASARRAHEVTARILVGWVLSV